MAIPRAYNPYLPGPVYSPERQEIGGLKDYTFLDDFAGGMYHQEKDAEGNLIAGGYQTRPVANPYQYGELGSAVAMNNPMMTNPLAPFTGAGLTSQWAQNISPWMGQNVAFAGPGWGGNQTQNVNQGLLSAGDGSGSGGLLADPNAVINGLLSAYQSPETTVQTQSMAQAVSPTGTILPGDNDQVVANVPSGVFDNTAGGDTRPATDDGGSGFTNRQMLRLLTNDIWNPGAEDPTNISGRRGGMAQMLQYLDQGGGDMGAVFGGQRGDKFNAWGGFTDADWDAPSDPSRTDNMADVYDRKIRLSHQSGVTEGAD